MVLDFWTYVNPILRILIYLVALISIGTILFNFHFEKYLDNDIKNYCNKILKSNSASGILLSIIVFFSIAGNLGGDIESIYSVDLINLSLETLQSKSILLLFIGFILLYLATKNLNFLSKILYFLLSFSSYFGQCKWDMIIECGNESYSFNTFKYSIIL